MDKTLNNEKEIEKIFYRGRTDRVFKSILCNEKNQRMLEWFLSLTLEKPIKIVKYLRNEQPVNTIVEKVRIVDLLVELEGEILHLELNNNLDGKRAKSIQRRNYIYVSSDYVSTVDRGEDYSKEHKMIAIDLSYGLGKSKPQKTHYYVQSAKGDKYIEDLMILVMNMDKVEEIWYNGTNEDKEKVRHLKMLNATKEELIKMSKGDEIMEEFTEQIVTLNENQHFRKLMSDEKAARMWENTERSLAREEGHEEGRKEGKNEERLTIIKAMVDNGVSIENISKMINIPISTIENILRQNNSEEKQN